MDVETYTAKAESESETIGRTIPLYRATATGTATGSGATQQAANIAAEEAAKRASRTAVETVRNITDLVWGNITTGFRNEYQLEPLEYYITFDPNHISYADFGNVLGSTVGSFLQAGFSGEAYKLVEFPTHIQPVGPHFGTISAFISAPVSGIVSGIVYDEYAFNITVQSAIHSSSGNGGLFIDKTYDFSSKMTWVGSFNAGSNTDPFMNMPSVVLAILNDDFSSLTGKYNYHSSKTDIALNSPGLALTDALGGKKNMVSNAAYDFSPVELVAPTHPKMYRVASTFKRAFVNTDPPELGQLVAYGAQDIRDTVVVTELGNEKKK